MGAQPSRRLQLAAPSAACYAFLGSAPADGGLPGTGSDFAMGSRRMPLAGLGRQHVLVLTRCCGQPTQNSAIPGQMARRALLLQIAKFYLQSLQFPDTRNDVPDMRLKERVHRAAVFAGRIFEMQ